MSENRGGARNRKPVPVSGGNADKARQGTCFPFWLSTEIPLNILKNIMKDIENAQYVFIYL